MRMRPWVVFAILSGISAIGNGQDFRVDTEVFFDQEKEPAVEALTIFSDGRVYDFLISQQEIVVFDPPRGQFILLDESRRIKAIVRTEELMEVTLELETHAVQSKSPELAFAARPNFETTSEEVKENGQDLVRLTLAGKPLTYTALGHEAAAPRSCKAVPLLRRLVRPAERHAAVQPAGRRQAGAERGAGQAGAVAARDHPDDHARQFALQSAARRRKWSRANT